MEFFDFLKIFFSEDEENYKKISKNEKDNFFIPLINIISKRYPDITNLINKEFFYSFQDVAVDFLRVFFKKQGVKNVPKWVYYKTGDDKDSIKENKEIIEYFKKRFGIDDRTVEDYLFVFGERGEKEIIDKTKLIMKNDDF
jgi:hypothetical protein